MWGDLSRGPSCPWVGTGPISKDGGPRGTQSPTGQSPFPPSPQRALGLLGHRGDREGGNGWQGERQGAVIVWHSLLASARVL